MAQGGSAGAAKNVVLVDGAFADDSSWSKILPLLKAKGFRVTTAGNPLTSFPDDVAATRRAIAAQDGPTVLAGHSYGGVVITDWLRKETAAQFAEILFAVEGRWRRSRPVRMIAPPRLRQSSKLLRKNSP